MLLIRCISILVILPFLLSTLTLAQVPLPLDPLVPVPSSKPLPGANQGVVPVSIKSSEAPRRIGASFDENKFTPLQKQFFQSGKSGADWLYRMNTVKGRFINGIRPALKVEMEEENFIHQTIAALALARAARIYKEDRFAVRASQAILLLLEETMMDPKNPSARYTVMPTQILDRQMSAGLMLLAICELPNPKADLLEAGEQFASYLKTTLQETSGIDKEFTVEEFDSKGSESAIAIAALLKSNQLMPMPWKVEVAKKAIITRWNAWKTQKDVAPSAWRILALNEAYKSGNEKAYAELAFEIADRLSTLQYDQIDPRKPGWYGGMKNFSTHSNEHMPTVTTCILAESFAVVCQCAQLAADISRHEKYLLKLEQALQFCQTIQYNDSNTLHYSDWFRPRLLGGFYKSAQDGDLRLDYTSHCVAAYTMYLQVCPIGS